MNQERTKPAFASLVSTIRSASQVASQDISFYKSLDSDLASSADHCGERLLNLANKLIGSVVQDRNEVNNLDNLESLQENWKDVAGVLDTLFEKTDIALAEKPENKIEVNESKLQTLGNSDTDKVVKHSKGLQKPQEKFNRKVDNSSDSPFKPLLTSKPNALQPLDLTLIQDELEERVDEDDNEDGSNSYYNEQQPQKIARPHYKQPYEYEIMNQKYPKMKIQEPLMYHDWKSTSHTYVDSPEKLTAMLKQLKKSKEIAVDLEHHDYRSFFGIVCLMQISNRDQDWIVDTLVLRDELQVLNEVFTDPKILKIFHGATMDIMWLQRDFGLYIVSLFDTFFASKALSLKRHGLAYLLETYANFQTSKKYQLADWRVRPIPHDMLLYARSDTHFLLYVYDKLRNELLEQSKLDSVLSQSRKLAAKRYEVPGYASEGNGYNTILAQYSMTRSQREVLAALYTWRDHTARHYDESPRYVMPNHFLAALCYTQPTNVNGVLGVSNGVTSHIRHSAKELAKLIQSIKDKKISDDQDEDSNALSGGSGRVNAELSKAQQAEANYEGYEREYKKAIKTQKKLFSTRKTNLIRDESMYDGIISGDESKAASDNDDSDGDDNHELERRRRQTENKLTLYVPMPQLTADAMDGEEDSSSDDDSDSNDKGVMQHEYVPTQKSTPSPEPQEEPASSESNKRKADEENDEGTKQNSKQKRMNKRRKLKIVDKDINIATKDEESMEAEPQEPHSPSSQEVPFNAFEYSSAPSVLKSGSGKAKDKKNAKKNRKESFNPRKYEDEGPQGVKRRRGPAGTRSITFKKR